MFSTTAWDTGDACCDGYSLQNGPVSSEHLTEKLGGGISISHGHSVEINAQQIGKNLHVFQNVTIGSRNTPEKPIIGDNVTIGAGAVVLGKIKIGNNVNIGANAVVVDDVPDNCTVVPLKSRIIVKQK